MFTEKRRTHGEKLLCAEVTPTHARTCKACLVLLVCAFHHAAAVCGRDADRAFDAVALVGNDDLDRDPAAGFRIAIKLAHVSRVTDPWAATSARSRSPATRLRTHMAVCVYRLARCLCTTCPSRKGCDPGTEQGSRGPVYQESGWRSIWGGATGVGVHHQRRGG